MKKRSQIAAQFVIIPSQLKEAKKHIFKKFINIINRNKCQQYEYTSFYKESLKLEPHSVEFYEFLSHFKIFP